MENMDIEFFETATTSYKHLLELKRIVGRDSFELYKTIQNGNPRTKSIRKKFLEELIELENKLDQ
jgi:hypothetical protein